MKIFFTFLVVVMASGCYSRNTFLKSYRMGDFAQADAVFEEPDGYVIAGCMDISQSGYLFLLKTNFLGDSVWTKLFPINRTGAFVHDYEVDNQGNKIIVVPQVGGENNIFKFDNSWNLIYNGNYNTPYPDKITILNDNNYLVSSKIHLNSLHVIHKINSETMEIMWVSDTIGFPGIVIQFGINTIIEYPDGEIFVLVNNYDWDGSITASFIFHLNSTGEVISFFITNDHVLGTIKPENDNLFSLAYRDYGHEGYNHLISYRPDGTIHSDTDITSDRISYRKFIEHDGKMVMIGYCYNPGNEFGHVAMGCYRNNEFTWELNHGNLLSKNDSYYPGEIIRTSDNGYLVVGTICLSDDIEDAYLPFLLKTDSIGSVIPVGIPEKERLPDFSIYPNPAKDQIFIEGDNTGQPVNAELYSSNGLKLKATRITGKRTSIDIKDLPAGIYILRITNKDKPEAHRFVKN